MKQYHDLLRDILDNGRNKEDRTGAGTRSVFGRQMRFNLADGFPILTTKSVHWKSVVAELVWMLSGDTNSRTLERQGVTIWKEWADEYGDLGPIYSAQWRKWAGVGAQVALGLYEKDTYDQISILLHNLRERPFSRRHVVSAWNVADLPDESMSPQDNASEFRMALSPCHMAFQCNVEPLTPKEREPYAFGTAPVGRLSLHLYARSIDSFLGLPFNIASYALLTHMLAQQTNMIVGDLIISFGDLHLYQNHIHPDIVFAQLAREPMPLPRLQLAQRESIFDYTLVDCKLIGYNPYTLVDCKLIGYNPWPAIKAPISV